jgi:hypothetical protein
VLITVLRLSLDMGIHHFKAGADHNVEALFRHGDLPLERWC